MARFFAFCFVAIIVIDICAAVMQQFSNQDDANTIATLMRVSSFTVLLLWYVFTFSRLTKAMKNHHNYEYERDWRMLWANFITQIVIAVLYFLDSVEVFEDWKSNDIDLVTFFLLCKDDVFFKAINKIWSFSIDTLYLADVIYCLIIYKFMRTDDNLQGISKLDHQLKVSLF